MGIGQDLLDLIAYGKEALKDLADETTGTLEITYQAIVDIWQIDCEGEWILYVRTGISAIGAALYLLITPSFEEVLENYLEPKPGRLGGRRGRPDDRDRRPGPRGRRQLYFKPGIPDIDSEVATWLPGSDMISGRKFGPGEWVFWTGINVADRISWNFLLVEATKTFFTRWMSGLMKGGKCKWENEGSCSFHTPTHHSFIAKNLWNNKLDLLFLVEENMDVSNNAHIFHPLGTHVADWFTTATTNFTMVGGAGDKYSELDVGIRIEAYDTINNKVLDETTTQTIRVYEGQTSTAAVTTAQFPNGANRIDYHYVVTPGHSSIPYTLEAWSEVAAAYRNTRVQ